MLTAVTAVLGSVLIAASALIQEPLMAGKWVATGIAGREVSVALDDKQLTIEYFDSGKSVRRDTIVFDGALHERRTAVKGREVVTKYTAAWQGTRLVLTTDTIFPDGAAMNGSETWSIDGKGQLVIDTVDKPIGPNQAVINGQSVLVRKK